jgi:NitT/TauT family transport system ATP-binding protein
MLDVSIASMQFQSADGGALTALQNIEFSCAENSFTSIVGPSGCGKTTTLRCILGLEKNYQGAITLHGVPAEQSDCSMAAVFQEPRLLPWRTVEQNVRLALSEAEKHRSLDQLFAELGITAHRSFFPAELSLGLARRVSLARAFSIRPELLILDEPFVSLDEETAVRLRQLLLAVWSSHTCTALLVTHNLSEAIELSDRILFYAGTPARVALDYLIEVPRRQRDVAEIEAIKQEIETLLAT